MKKYGKILIISILIPILFISAKAKQDDFELFKYLEIFSDVVKQIYLNYVDDINVKKLITTSINSMLSELDPYTNFISEDDIESARFIEKGQYSGIGILTDTIENQIYIIQVLRNSPAAKENIKIGDIIVEINGKKITSNDFFKLNEYFNKSPKGIVNLKLKRNKEIFSVEIKKKNIIVPKISYSDTIENFGYIQLSNFFMNSYNEFKKALKKLETNEINGLIIDLRDNPGGLLGEAQKIVNLFLDKNKLVVRVKGKNIDTSYYTTKKPEYKNIPIVILVNENSASASEILSGALQDYDRAVIIGRQTYGKGLVQQIFDLSYNNKMKITVSRYYLPSGRCIQAVDYQKHKNFKTLPDSLLKKFYTQNKRVVYEAKGIKPDIIIKESKTDFIEKLEAKRLIFLYSINYYYKNQDKKFEIKKFDFNDKASFVEFLKTKNFEYHPKGFKYLDSLLEFYKNENLETEVKEIEQLKKDLNKDIEYFVNQNFDYIKNQIKRYLILLYLGNEELIKYDLKRDKEVKKGIEILKDEKKYNQILNIKN